MPTIPSGLRRRARPRADVDARALMAELRRRRLTCRLVAEALIDEERLVVRCRRSAVTAELLWPGCGGPEPTAWCAVRVDYDRRDVWCGPAQGCGNEKLAQFLDDLLRLAPDELRRRYRLRG